jgi:hypothetical protein
MNKGRFFMVGYSFLRKSVAGVLLVFLIGVPLAQGIPSNTFHQQSEKNTMNSKVVFKKTSLSSHTFLPTDEDIIHVTLRTPSTTQSQLDTRLYHQLEIFSEKLQLFLTHSSFDFKWLQNKKTVVLLPRNIKQ